MPEQSERLSASAAKGKRNLLFLGVLAWALACGWLQLESAETKVGLFGVAVTASVRVVIVGLGGLLIYNLISFWLHGPFGDSRKALLTRSLLNPEKGHNADARELLLYIRKWAGENALPDGITASDKLDGWLNTASQSTRWSQYEPSRKVAVNALWKHLSLKTKLKLSWRGVFVGHVRKLMLEDPLDLWLPFAIGLSGLVAVAIAGYSYWNFQG